MPRTDSRPHGQRPAFHVAQSGQVLTLTLDTPNATVNVFGPPAAAQLERVLRELPRSVEALVLRSSKPGSFINGAGLLYAQSMSSAEAALATSAPVRAVYEQLHAARVMKVSFIEGNCFGCGLELALCCDVRIARDVDEAQFRMTELVDYRFVPLFGGTWRLPARVGAHAAARLLLDGERWSARAALRHGLVDRVVPRAQDVTDATLLRLVRGSKGSHAPAMAEKSERLARSAALRREVPPTRAWLWEQTADLLEAAQRRTPSRARAAEVAAFAHTVVSAEAKAAMSFFFVRHAARAASLGSADRLPPTLSVALPSELAPRERRSDLDGASPGTPRRKLLHLASSGPRYASAPGIRVLRPGGPRSRFCEVHASQSALPLAREVARALEWRDLEVVLTRASSRHARPLDGAAASERLIQRTRSALAALIDDGVSPGGVVRALWDVGFAAPFRWSERHRRWPRGTSSDARVLPRLLHAWRSELRMLYEDGTLFHPSQGDVLVHGLFDFPLEAGALSRPGPASTWLHAGGPDGEASSQADVKAR